MTTDTTTTASSHPERFALRPVRDQHLPDGAWWPQGRQLGDQLTELFTSWPRTEGRIARVLYSPPDWDDRPRSVHVPGRRVKTGCFPEDDTHRLVLSMLDGERRIITVIPPATPADVAHGLLDEILDPNAKPTAAPAVETPVWDNEGGHS